MVRVPWRARCLLVGNAVRRVDVGDRAGGARGARGAGGAGGALAAVVGVVAGLVVAARRAAPSRAPSIRHAVASVVGDVRLLVRIRALVAAVRRLSRALVDVVGGARAAVIAVVGAPVVGRGARPRALQGRTSGVRLRVVGAARAAAGIVALLARAVARRVARVVAVGVRAAVVGGVRAPVAGNAHAVVLGGVGLGVGVARAVHVLHAGGVGVADRAVVASVAVARAGVRVRVGVGRAVDGVVRHAAVAVVVVDEALVAHALGVLVVRVRVHVAAAVRVRVALASAGVEVEVKVALARHHVGRRAGVGLARLARVVDRVVVVVRHTHASLLAVPDSRLLVRRAVQHAARAALVVDRAVRPIPVAHV
mmetsp:Transcript_3107/g.11125  ORF Transcript_3107/g.11125 Transcript_3107/m.11125 type:complete len:366 (-) Transcript_3107:63-1160(-)